MSIVEVDLTALKRWPKELREFVRRAGPLQEALFREEPSGEPESQWDAGDSRINKLYPEGV